MSTKEKFYAVVTALVYITLAIGSVFLADKCTDNRMKRNKEKAELALSDFFKDQRYSVYVTAQGEEVKYSEKTVKFYRDCFNQRDIKVDPRFKKEIGNTIFRNVTSAYDINPDNTGWIVYSLYGHNDGFTERIMYPYSVFYKNSSNPKNISVEKATEEALVPFSRKHISTAKAISRHQVCNAVNNKYYKLTPHEPDNLFFHPLFVENLKPRIRIAGCQVSHFDTVESRQYNVNICSETRNWILEYDAMTDQRWKDKIKFVCLFESVLLLFLFICVCCIIYRDDK